jgi:hypothetical protein
VQLEIKKLIAILRERLELSLVLAAVDSVELEEVALVVLLVVAIQVVLVLALAALLRQLASTITITAWLFV